MTKILITGHGNYADGILSALKLIYGNTDNIIGLNFLGEDTEEYKLKLKSILNNEVTLIITDIVGGTPFNEAIKTISLLNKKGKHVIGGPNLALIIDIVITFEGKKNIDNIELINKISRISESVKIFSF